LGLTACDFWFSVDAGGSGARMGQRKMISLMRAQLAQQAFTDIGAVRVASVLRALVAG
jgi:hypothetical protein